MAVFPRQNEKLPRTAYPDWTEMEKGLEPIGMPGWVYGPTDWLKKAWSGLTDFNPFPKGTKKDGPEPVPKKKLAYNREGIERTGVYSRDAMNMFYNRMSMDFGLPLREVPYNVMTEYAGGGKILPGRYVAGLHIPGKMILVSKTDGEGIFIFNILSG